MPTRKIPKNYRNVTGIVSSHKGVDIAGFESTLERDVITLMEFDSEVKSYEVQPIRISWNDENQRKRSYTPDLLVKFHHKKPILYEIKYFSDICDSLQEQRKKFKAAIAFARSKGWRFKFISERCIDQVFLKNAKFLLSFMSQGPREEGHLEILESQLPKTISTTPKSLIKSIYSDEWNQAAILPSLWYMIGTKQIGCDLKQPLTMNSSIWRIER